MNLYRLDYLTPEGATGEAVHDWRGDYLARSAATARTDASTAAQAAGAPVAITRISGGGSMKRTGIAHPDGRITRPEAR
jgi:hypothetical protein